MASGLADLFSKSFSANLVIACVLLMCIYRCRIFLHSAEPQVDGQELERSLDELSAGSGRAKSAAPSVY